MDDAEIAARFAAQDAVIAALLAELAALKAALAVPKGEVIQLKQAAHEARCSVETMRKRALNDPAWKIHNGRWSRSA